MFLAFIVNIVVPHHWLLVLFRVDDGVVAEITVEESLKDPAMANSVLPHIKLLVEGMGIRGADEVRPEFKVIEQKDSFSWGICRFQGLRAAMQRGCGSRG